MVQRVQSWTPSWRRRLQDIATEATRAQDGSDSLLLECLALAGPGLSPWKVYRDFIGQDTAAEQIEKAHLKPAQARALVGEHAERLISDLDDLSKWWKAIDTCSGEKSVNLDRLRFDVTHAQAHSSASPSTRCS